MKTSKALFHAILSLITIFVLLGGMGFSPAHPVTAAQALPAAEALPVIVQATSAQQAADLVTAVGGTVTSTLDVINAVGARVPAPALARLSQAEGIVRVTSNAATQLSAASYDKKGKHTPEADYPEVVGADLVWEQAATGKGIGIAILDTGIAQHPALMKDVDGRPRKVVTSWVDFVEGKKTPTDPNGHGTHIAGIIANAAVGPDGSWNGVAPGANLIGVRVLDKTGAGDYEKVIQGIQWVIANKERYNIQVMNLSLHALVQSPYWADPLNQAVMQAWASGITVVVAAGNEGPSPMSISVPGNNPYVITVGAFTDNYTPNDWNDDYLADFSAAGPTLDGFVKPDLLAPGAHMTSTMMKSSYIARNHEANWVDGQYFAMAGTSQAAAVVSGITALMLQHNPGLTPDQVKYRLMITALPWINADQTDVLYSVWQQGFGRVNAYDAVFGQVNGYANRNMDIQGDLAGTQHYEGYSYFDEATGMFRLHGHEDMTSGFGAWAGNYGTWSGGFGAWADGFGAWADGFGAWADGFGAWADGFGAWADGFGAWADGFGAWAGGFGAWAGGFGAWAGGFGAWAGGFGAWAGGFGAWAGRYTDPAFIANFLSGTAPDASTSSAGVIWVTEP